MASRSEGGASRGAEFTPPKAIQPNSGYVTGQTRISSAAVATDGALGVSAVV